MCCFAGTGKTSIAQLYGKILKSLGYLSKGEVIIKTPVDFVGDVLGQSEKNTKAILDNSRGSILVIDEAYGLAPAKGTTDPYRTAVIDTIVAEVQGVPGDDRCVLLLGYEDDMKSMIRNANPGLQRRFQVGDAFKFEDYSDEDLMFILRARAEKEQVILSFETAKAAIRILSDERKCPNFGNAGAVNTLLSRAVQNMEARLEAVSSEERAQIGLAEHDFLTAEQIESRSLNLDSLFQDIVGCESIKQQVKRFTETIAFSKKQGQEYLCVYCPYMIMVL